MDDDAVQPTATLIDECSLEHEEAATTTELSNLDKSIEGKTNKSKNSSIEEDLLGLNSLLMSDSDGGDDDGTTKSITPSLEKIEKVVESNEIHVNETINDEMSKEQVNNDPMNKKVMESEEIRIAQNKKKKYSGILNTDSENEDGKAKDEQVTRKKISAIIDSDSDSTKEEEQPQASSSKASKKSNHIDFDGEKRKTKKLLKKKIHKIKPGIIDSDSETNSDTESSKNKEDMTIHDEGEEIDGAQPKPKRVSAKKALDQMQAIQSEQQRLHREAHISVPYHKPKRYTLQEFLKRRTIINPAAASECSPAATILKNKSLKMTSEELEEYAQLMEDRAREAKEFFKSETESDEEIQTNSDAIVVDHNKNKNEEEKNEEIIENIKVIQTDEETTKIETIAMEIPIIEGQQHNECNNEIEMDKENSNDNNHISSQPLITEVLQLPNLDLSTLHVQEKDEIIHISIATGESSSSHLRQQLPILSDSPTIKGDRDMIIDLESGDMTRKKPNGADNLLQRLLATHKSRKSKGNDTVSILSTENGRLEMTKINIHIPEEEVVTKEQKPGAAYVKLKENLRTLIKKKRLEEMQKKQIDENEYNKCLGEDDDDDDNDEENDEINDDEYEVEKDEVDEEEEQDKDEANELFEDEALESTENQRLEEIMIDEDENPLDICEEVEEDDENMDEEVELEANEDENEENNVEDETADTQSDELKSKQLPSPTEPTPSQRKSRIIQSFAADSDDDDDDDIDWLKTQVPVEQSNIKIPLFDSPVKNSIRIPCSIGSIDSTQELLDLCSGTFDATQQNQRPTIATADTVLMSQIPITQPTHLNAATEDELLGLCSGTFEGSASVEQTQQTQETKTDDSTRQTVAYKILSSDDEEDGNNGETRQKRVKKLRKKLKNRQVKLGFSDDEDDAIESNEHAGEEEEEEEDEAEETEIPATYVEYDSEENEIVVETTTKNDWRVENFVENEAELSESDWGSADEDEKNLDHYDIELGDEDEFDRGELHQELGRIHARKILDEDIREVRKIQAMLFEDEETDGVGRQRQFRWRNVENGFSLDDSMRANGEDGMNGESGDEEQKQEHLWRKIRFEREQLLKERGLIESSQEFTSSGSTLATTAISKDKNLTPILNSNGKKLQIITKKSTSRLNKQKGSPFLISSSTSVMKAKTTTSTITTPVGILQPKVTRGSFLTRFVNIAKGRTALGDDNETAGPVLAKGKNFVFTTITKEEHENLKRKADQLLSSSTDTGTNFMKKPRKNVEKECLIDQLQM